MKKVLALVLALAMVTMTLTACGDGKDPVTSNDPVVTDSAEPTDSTEPDVEPVDISEPVTLKWYLHGSNVSNDTEVLAAVNEYLGEKLNVTLEPIWGTWADFDENAVISLQTGNDVDIYFTCSWSADEYNRFARDGYWVRLDDPENDLIARCGKEVFDLLPEPLIDAATIEGSEGKGIYAVPGYKDFATQNCWDVNVTLLEKYGYTLEDVKGMSYYDMGDMFAKVKAGEGEDFYPLCIEGAVLERMVTNSIIVTGDNGAVNLLSYYLNPDDVSAEGAYGNTMLNKFATDEYKAFVEKTREYAQAGYIDPALGNSLNANQVRTDHQLAATYLIGTQSYALGYEATASEQRGITVEFVPTTAPYVDTTAAQGAMMAISSASKNPERAMMFLNLLNTDPYLMTLVAYGVEGTHYTKDDQGIITKTDAAGDYSPWRNGLGNITILPVMTGEGGPDFWDQFVDYYNTAKAIPVLGFIFDGTNVETESAALANVAAEYALPLSTGQIDPATKLPEFLDAMNAAGIEKYVAEAQSQLDSFLANK